jgi:hypothetical protein
VPNPHRGEYKIDIGGEERTFRYSLNKLAMLQEKLGVKAIDEFESTLAKMGFADVRFLIWLGVQKWNEGSQSWDGPSESEVGEWEIDIEEMGGHLQTAMLRAFRANQAPGDEDEEEEGSPTEDPQVTPAEDSTSPG